MVPLDNLSIITYSVVDLTTCNPPALTSVFDTSLNTLIFENPAVNASTVI